MKKLVTVGMLFVLTGCAHNLLTSDKKPVVRNFGNVSLNCAFVNEWKLGENKEVGCWCMMPPLEVPGGNLILFNNVPDQFCDENLTEKQLFEMFQ